MQPFLPFYLSGAILLAVACCATKDKTRVLLANALLLLLTVFAAHFLFVGVTTSRIGKSNPAVAAEQAEMGLRIVSCVNSLSRQLQLVKDNTPLKSHLRALSGEKDKAQADNAFAIAEKALDAALVSKPTSTSYLSKMIVVLGEDLDEANNARISEFESRLTAADQKDPKSAGLGKLLGDIYGRKQFSGDLDASKQIIEAAFPAGWYRENALAQLYEVSGRKQLFEQQLNAIDERNIRTLYRIVGVFSLIAVCGVIGIINILVQLYFSLRRSTVDPVEQPSLTVPLRSVYAVFISWFCIQILMSTLAHAALNQIQQGPRNPTMLATATGLTYLASNLPGPLLVYFLALKPNGLNFKDALKLKWRTSTAGPIKMLIMGWLGWCSAIPLVFTSAFIASKLLGSNSSDNPVIAQIVQAASAANPAAIIIFYFTLGVMAPFFEEILFRGFLYSSFKSRAGVLVAALGSAGTFALLHFDKGGALMLFAIGLVLAITYERTRSLIPAMVAHGLWNSGSFTLALVLFSNN